VSCCSGACIMYIILYWRPSKVSGFKEARIINYILVLVFQQRLNLWRCVMEISHSSLGSLAFLCLVTLVKVEKPAPLTATLHTHTYRLTPERCTQRHLNTLCARCEGKKCIVRKTRDQNQRLLGKVLKENVQTQLGY
jgi:hypothetical protein